MPKLIAIEKTAVTQAIDKALGITERRDGDPEGGNYFASWCVGYLVELAPPGNYGLKLVE